MPQQWPSHQPLSPTKSMSQKICTVLIQYITPSHDRPDSYLDRRPDDHPGICKVTRCETPCKAITGSPSYT